MARLLRVPASTARAPRPLILAFHGGGATGAGFKRYAGLDDVAEREGLVVAYGDGFGRWERRFLTWRGPLLWTRARPGDRRRRLRARGAAGRGSGGHPSI